MIALASLVPACRAAAAVQQTAGTFLNILPPGEGSNVNALQAAAFESATTYPPHANDQYAMYENLLWAPRNLSDASLGSYFKDAAFGVPAGDVASTEHPRPGVTITRDKGFGVAHVYGVTRSDVMFGAGYANAEDRLFLMDVARHEGRAELSGFVGSLGGLAEQLDESQWRTAPYDEGDLQAQFDNLSRLYGAEGAQLQQDIRDYVAGINAFISAVRLDPTRLPVEYVALGKIPQYWTPDDLVGISAGAGTLFGEGGGAELLNAEILQAAEQRFGGRGGTQVWNDFREADDPEAPTTVQNHRLRFPYAVPRGVSRAALALPDPGSLQAVGAAPGGIPQAAGPTAGVLAGLAGAHAITHMSNALLVSARDSRSGHPLAVMGPQVGYFIPELLVEEDLHGPGIDARGVAPIGLGMYVLAGHGLDYAWSLTSAGQDDADTFAERLCEPDGSRPTIDSMYYVFRGRCEPIEVLHRTDDVEPNVISPGAPHQLQLTAERTVHGVIVGRATVHGVPVAYARMRSTYFHEIDWLRALSQLNDPDRIRGPRSFQRAAYKSNFAFNWFYVDAHHIAYLNSGDNPVRAPGADPSLPVWGTARWVWRGFDPALHTADYTPIGQHPQVIDQAFITSWNNKQAAGYAAADNNYSFGPVFRSQLLDDRIRAALRGGRKLTLAQLVQAMEDAATVDLRGAKALPWMLRVVGTPRSPALAAAVRTLKAWLRSGAHRIDRNRDGVYDDARAVQIMDAWWPLAVKAEFMPALGPHLFDLVEQMMPLDNPPNNGGEHLGSAYQSGWEGYVDKDLRDLLAVTRPASHAARRQPHGRRSSARSRRRAPAAPQGRYSRIYCGLGNLARCRAGLRASLAQALTIPATQLYHDPGGGCRDGDQGCYDEIRFLTLGIIKVPPIEWVNRPTFQQAVEVDRSLPRPSAQAPPG